MKTFLRRCAVPLIAPALAVSLLLASPATADAPDVVAADLPSVKQFRSVYPSMKKSTFGVVPNEAVTLVKSCRKTTYLRPRTSLLASISNGRSGTNSTIAYVSVSQMKSVKDAKRVIAGQRRTAKCSSITVDGITAKSRTIKASALGTERVALATTYTYADGSSGSASEFYFRDGARVTEVVVFPAGKPDHAKARKLAKLAYRVGR